MIVHAEHTELADTKKPVLLRPLVICALATVAVARVLAFREGVVQLVGPTCRDAATHTGWRGPPYLCGSSSRYHSAAHQRRPRTIFPARLRRASRLQRSVADLLHAAIQAFHHLLMFVRVDLASRVRRVRLERGGRSLPFRSVICTSRCPSGLLCQPAAAPDHRRG